MMFFTWLLLTVSAGGNTRVLIIKGDQGGGFRVNVMHLKHVLRV